MQTNAKKIAFLFMFTYMASYITRISYGAIISEMESATGMAKDLLSLALTGGFVTYGAGQIISGICGDRFSPKKLVSYGLIVTVLMNLLIPFCTNHYQMLAVWCINGFAQSFMWPPLVRLMTALLTEDEYKETSVMVSWGSSFGTMVVYLCSPIIISVASWKAVFGFTAFLGFLMLLVWNKLGPEIAVAKKEKDAGKVSFKSAIIPMLTPVTLCIMIAIIVQGMLRDGLTTWMPTYISETYGISNVMSILTGVLMPIFSIVCLKGASVLYRNVIKNPLVCAGAIFSAGVVSAVALMIFTGRNAVLSMIFYAALIGCMHGVNLILICMIPPFFKKYGNVSTVSGVLNSCTYIGGAISTYGIAVISQSSGWSFTVLLWLCAAVIGAVLCFAGLLDRKNALK